MARGLRLPPAPFGPDGVVFHAVSGGGLRGGWLRRSGGAHVDLHAVRYLTDVGLSGTLDLSSEFSSLVVRGPGAIRARAIVRRNSGDLVPKLGGRSIHARITRGIDAIAN